MCNILGAAKGVSLKFSGTPLLLLLPQLQLIATAITTTCNSDFLHWTTSDSDYNYLLLRQLATATTYDSNYFNYFTTTFRKCRGDLEQNRMSILVVKMAHHQYHMAHHQYHMAHHNDGDPWNILGGKRLFQTPSSTLIKICSIHNIFKLCILECCAPPPASPQGSVVNYAICPLFTYRI